MEVKSNTSGKPRHPQVGSDLQAPKAGARSQRDPVLSLQSRQLRVCTNVQNQQEESVDFRRLSSSSSRLWKEARKS